ncbi:hypothetical protein E2562_003393 [Oryza meyeriana var. granulata]|uniref:Uncharacterized protein n=1 Tax=Oryza meyeriana var. granulata TaxID=110450 RepID=A0A6G1EFJ8_9ORYZ|nr:hypothetical protein E2562_003393 [Oryza meyeriana var. granulata]
MALSFSVRRRDPVLIAPAAPTPRETKRLSDLDDQETLRGLLPNIFVYRGGQARDCRGDPVDIILRAIAVALVPYYPLAGRLREGEDQKLVVDCTGEGVLFVEADADVRVAELEDAGLRPPFPCSDQLLVGVESSGAGGVVNSPLLLIQVTRLLCGGFVMGLSLNHVICDAAGLVQFMNAVADHARGRRGLAVSPPPWCRELLDARNPPRPAIPLFGPGDIAALKEVLPLHLRGKATSFEVLAAFVWRAHVAALDFPPGEDAHLAFIVNFRSNGELGLPPGYYGNAGVPATVSMPAEALLRSPLGDVVEQVRNAKATVTAEYVRSMADALVLRGRQPPLTMAKANPLFISDVRRAGLHRVDFGWGEPLYGGPSRPLFGSTFFVPVKDDAGEDAVAVPVVLPAAAMERFAFEIERAKNFTRQRLRSCL